MPWCQTENRDGARFCRECGATLGTVCTACGAKVEAGSRFCDSCGTPLAAAPTFHGAAIGLASELSMHPLVAHCHLGLRRLHRRAGDHTKAEPHLATTAAMYHEMGMSFWLEKMETTPLPAREAPRP